MSLIQWVIPAMIVTIVVTVVLVGWSKSMGNSITRYTAPLWVLVFAISAILSTSVILASAETFEGASRGLLFAVYFITLVPALIAIGCMAWLLKDCILARRWLTGRRGG